MIATLAIVTVSGYSQTLLNDSTVAISNVQMDTIVYRLIRYDGLKKENHLLNLQVADLKLVVSTKDSIISFQSDVIYNNNLQLGNYQDAIGELSILVGESEQITKYAKKQVRKRWVIISVACLIGGFTAAVVVF